MPKRVAPGTVLAVAAISTAAAPMAAAVADDLRVRSRTAGSTTPTTAVTRIGTTDRLPGKPPTMVLRATAPTTEANPTAPERAGPGRPGCPGRGERRSRGNPVSGAPSAPLIPSRSDRGW